MSDGLVTDYPALRRPRLKAGVGAKTATMIWAVVAAIALIMGFPWGLIFIPIGAITHGGLKWFFLKDPHIMALYVVHEIVPNNLHAGFPSHGEVTGSRPSGYAKTLPIT